jgi:hypothetical protein
MVPLEIKREQNLIKYFTRRNKMKKLIPFVIAIILMAGIVYFALAADQPGGMMKGTMAKQGMMDSNDMMMGKTIPMMCPMHMMMAQQMMGKEIVATSDGGAIVMVDNKLFKYDKDLNLVKDVDLKIDTKAMQEKMQTMMKECAEKCQMMKPQGKMGSM